MTAKLFFQAILKFAMGALGTAALIFIPAGTTDYPGGWLLMCLLFIPMFLVGIIMMFKNPTLLGKRLKAREAEAEQRTVIVLSGIMFLIGFMAAGFSFRHEWATLPQWASWAGAAVFAISYLLYGEVLRENTYLSRTIEVQEGQKVIDTGLYGIVRHPMYSATLLLFFSMPIVLGSAAAVAVFLAYPFIIIKRIKNEEQVLEEQLDGYREYKKKVKYRLIPFIW